MSREKRDFLIIIVGKLLQIVFMLAIIKVSTTLLSSKDMGSLYMVMTFSSLFMLIFLNPVGQYIQRHLNEWKEQGFLANNILYFILYIIFISFVSVL
jgi:O-antigen/teichoic acid export membrane protein